MSPPSPTDAPPKAHAAIRAIVDYGGLMVFAVAYFLKLRLVSAGGGWSLAMGGPGPRDLTAATLWLVVGSFLALALGLIAERRIAPLPLIAGVVALVFGGLTLAFHDPRFIKIKFTVTNLAFGVGLLSGLALGRNPLKWMLGESLVLPEDAWRTLTFRYAAYFLAEAALNEAVWRTQPDKIWVLFRMPGTLILVALFSISQVPFMMKHLHTAVPPPPPTD